MEGAARSNLKRVTLELGGKSPNVIYKDADRKFYTRICFHLYIKLGRSAFFNLFWNGRH